MSTPSDVFLTSEEVAAVFRVDAKTVTRWARLGYLEAFKPPGGKRRLFRREDVEALLARPEEGQASA